MSEIAQVAVRHGFGYFFARNKLTDLLPWRESLPESDGSPSERGQRLREMLDELGPTFVKFGQLLSTRPDIVPPDIIVELRKLQDEVTPVPFSQVREVVEQELGQPIERLFLEFDETPIAAASIGQVHAAVLPNGRRVAVKVQRPTAPRQIEADLGLLYQAAKIAKDRVRALDFVDAKQLVDEFGRSLREELDYRVEAKNAQAFHRHFAGDRHVEVPRVFSSYSGARVLTLEFLEGTQVADLDLDVTPMEDRRRLAYLMAEAWMAMIFRHGFFHGDPHPANVLVLGSGPDRARRLRAGGKAHGRRHDEADRAVHRRGCREHRGAAQAPERSGRALRQAPGGGVRRLSPRALRPLLRRPALADIDPVQAIREAFELIYTMNLHLPARFVLLDKAIATLGSVGAELYPDFNVFEIAKPYARALVVERFTPGRMAGLARKEARDLARIARVMPYQIHDILEVVREGRLEVRLPQTELDEAMRHLDVAMNRLVVALVVAAGLIGSSFLAAAATGDGLRLLSGIGFGLSLLLGIWLMWGVIRHGRL